MRRPFVSLVAAAFTAGLLILGCSQAAPAPTQAPAAQPKPAEPTKVTAPVEPTKAPAAAAQPTAAPAKKVDFPTKGKVISLIVPYSPGGGTDLIGRVLAPLMEKELGTSVDVVNKAGGGAQVGTTDVATSKPDGYTIGMTNLPTLIPMYLDPERQAVFGRKDLLPVAVHNFAPDVLAVKADGPYKTLKDLADAVKAKPGTINLSTSGIMSDGHLAILLLERAIGAKLLPVNFSGSGEAVTAMIGGQTGAYVNPLAAVSSFVKSGEARVLAVADKEPSPFLPDVKTFQAQGYDVQMGATYPFWVRAGTPKEIVDILGAAIKKSMEAQEHKKKAEELGFAPRFLDSQQAMAHWDEIEARVKPLIDLVKQGEKKK